MINYDNEMRAADQKFHTWDEFRYLEHIVSAIDPRQCSISIKAENFLKQQTKVPQNLHLFVYDRYGKKFFAQFFGIILGSTARSYLKNHILDKAGEEEKKQERLRRELMLSN